MSDARAVSTSPSTPPVHRLCRALLLGAAAAASLAFAGPLRASDFLTNPDFRSSISGWTAQGAWVHNPSAGAFGAVGSAEVTSSGAGTQVLSQCVDVSMVAPGHSIALAGFANTVNHSSAVDLELETYGGADCTASLVDVRRDSLAAPQQGVWTGLYFTQPVPPGAVSARVRLKATSTAAGQTTRFDQTSLRYDLIADGDFTNSLASWTQYPPASWGIVADGLSTPAGAAEGLVSADGSVFLAQCRPLSAVPRTPIMQSWVRVKALDELADYQLSFQFWDNEICAPPGNLLGTEGLLTRPVQTGAWSFFFRNDIVVPAGAESVAVYVALNPGGGTPGTRFRVDDLILAVTNGLFSDSFEAGTSSAWSGKTP